MQYLKENRKVLYTDLLTSSKLNSYLGDIDLQASERLERLTEGEQDPEETDRKMDPCIGWEDTVRLIDKIAEDC